MSVWLVGQRARPAPVVSCRPVTRTQPWPAHPAQDGTELGAGAIVSRGRSQLPRDVEQLARRAETNKT